MFTYISGLSGFVGKNLRDYLNQAGYSIQAIHLRSPEFISFPQHAQAVIHLVGRAHDLRQASRPETYYEVNTTLTKKVFDAFLLSEAKMFITLSSVKAAADTVEGVLTEDVVPNPQTHYGKSKLLAEAYILSQDLPEWKRIYMLRPCMIHGPGNKGNLNLLYKLISKRIPWPLAAFNNQRSFLSIDNLCFVIKELMEQGKDIPSGIYQIADDTPLSTNELVGIIAKALNFKPCLWRIPTNTISTIARIGNILRLPFNTEQLEKLTSNYVVSNQKIKLALKKELPLSSYDGLMKTIASFKK